MIQQKSSGLIEARLTKESFKPLAEPLRIYREADEAFKSFQNIRISP